ncbi:MAG: outer membrane protein assembly factor BamB family protein, partial [Planctomycetota bacterium]
KAWYENLGEKDWRNQGSLRTHRPLSLPMRLAAAEDRVFVTLGNSAPVSVLDAATGRTIKTFPKTEGTEEILHHDGKLFLCLPLPENKERKGGIRRRLICLEANTGQVLWETPPSSIAPMTLCLRSERICYHDGKGVQCLDGRTGKPVWHAPVGVSSTSLGWIGGILLQEEEAVLYRAGGRARNSLFALSAKDGKLLWALDPLPGGNRGGGVCTTPEMLVAGGLVWPLTGTKTLKGYDLETGKVRREIPLHLLLTEGHHARCYRAIGTSRYILFPKRGVEFLDISGTDHGRFDWARGACRFGLLPANGILYTTPHPCFCYAGVKLGGFHALVPREESAPEFEGKWWKLIRGPVFDGVKNGIAAGPEDWPCYRRDAELSGATSARIPADLETSWETDLGGKLTPAVVVGERLFVARIDAGEIACLDRRTGRRIWSHPSGGRIDSAPSYWQGRLLFGSSDGWVTCLRASDGETAWRLRAAPAERRMMSHGRVESVWPVHGSILIFKGTAYFVVGRSSLLDGGLGILGVDPQTGEVRHHARMKGPLTTGIPENPSMDTYDMEGAKSDLLTTDGERIYLFHNAWNERLEPQPVPHMVKKRDTRNLGERRFPSAHLYSNAGFLDDSTFNRNYWMHGDRWGAFNFAQQAPKAGQLVVFDDRETFSVKYFSRRNKLSPLFFPETDGYFLAADPTEREAVLVNEHNKGDFLAWLPQGKQFPRCWNLGIGFARSHPPVWMESVPVRVRAMVLSSDRLYVAGPPDLLVEGDERAAFEGRAGAKLLVVDRKTGKALQELDLSTPPVFDGMILAKGDLFLSTLDGKVVRFTGNQSKRPR